MIAELGAQAIGALPLGLYQDSISAELARMLEAADARVIVAEDQEQVDKVLEVRDRVPGWSASSTTIRGGCTGTKRPV